MDSRGTPWACPWAGSGWLQGQAGQAQGREITCLHASRYLVKLMPPAAWSAVSLAQYSATQKQLREGAVEFGPRLSDRTPQQAGPARQQDEHARTT